MEYLETLNRENASLHVENDNLKHRIDELEYYMKCLRETIIGLSKRAVYTDKEKEEYYEFDCKCGLSGLSIECGGGNQIGDTGDYSDVTCPSCFEIIE